MKRRLETALALVIALMVVLADQATKWLAMALIAPTDRIPTWLPFWDWVLWFNSGAAFSFLAWGAGWQRYVLLGFGLTAAVGLVVLIHRESERRIQWCYALVLGGALGNSIDRLHLPGVVDFILWHIGDYYWPAFNLADAGISVAVVMLIRASFKQHKKERQP